MLLNEVLDAVPPHIVVRRGGQWLERGVVWNGGLAWDDRPLTDEALRARAVDRFPPEGDYTSEIKPAAEALVASLARRVRGGALFVFDYGFPQREYYHADRHEGTLMGHYRHRAHADPFLWPGLTDLTAHVDFTAIALAGERGGLTAAGYTSLAAFLVAAGILDRLGEAATRRRPPTSARRRPCRSSCRRRRWASCSRSWCSLQKQWWYCVTVLRGRGPHQRQRRDPHRSSRELTAVRVPRRGREPVGYSLDLCEIVVEEIVAELAKDVRVELKPVTPENRFDKVTSGEIDLECGSTTNNAERRKTVAFSPTMFVTGTKLMVRRGSGILNFRNLADKTVVLTRGTVHATASPEARRAAADPDQVRLRRRPQGLVESLAAGKPMVRQR